MHVVQPCPSRDLVELAQQASSRAESVTTLTGAPSSLRLAREARAASPSNPARADHHRRVAQSRSRAQRPSEVELRLAGSDRSLEALAGGLQTPRPPWRPPP